AVEGVEHGTRLLRGGRVVEVDQRLAVRLLPQDGEFFPQPTNVERGRPGGGAGNRAGGHGNGHSRSFTPAPCGRARTCSSSFSRSSRRESVLIRPITSLAKAYVKSARASSLLMPRDRR